MHKTKFSEEAKTGSYLDSKTANAIVRCDKRGDGRLPGALHLFPSEVGGRLSSQIVSWTIFLLLASMGNPTSATGKLNTTGSFGFLCEGRFSVCAHLVARKVATGRRNRCIYAWKRMLYNTCKWRERKPNPPDLNDLNAEGSSTRTPRYKWLTRTCAVSTTFCIGYSPIEEANASKSKAIIKSIGMMYIVDSGASSYKVKESSFLSLFLRRKGKHSHRPKSIWKKARVYIQELGTQFSVKLMEDSPSVLSFGRLCDESWYSDSLQPGANPRLTKGERTITYCIDTVVPLVAVT